jgi:hypothetical protein
MPGIVPAAWSLRPLRQALAPTIRGPDPFPGAARAAAASAVDLKLPIRIVDELSDDEVHATGVLDLASGDILNVQHQDYDLGSEGLPAEREDYEFTCGVLSNGSKEVEFRVEVDVLSGRYSVTASELLELKGRAAKLFTAPPPGTRR